jgi:hypothetical protein
VTADTGARMRELLDHLRQEVCRTDATIQVAFLAAHGGKCLTEVADEAEAAVAAFEDRVGVRRSAGDRRTRSMSHAARRNLISLLTWAADTARWAEAVERVVLEMLRVDATAPAPAPVSYPRCVDL